MPDVDLYDVLAEKHGVVVTRNVKAIIAYSGGAMLIGLSFSFFMAGSWQGVGILTVAALACIAIGILFGFLFGIPRSAQNAENISKSTANGNQPHAVSPRDNTNLEQISDWLVKILIGASLVQMDRVKQLLEHAAAALCNCLEVYRHMGTTGVESDVPGVVTNAPAVALSMTNPITGAVTAAAAVPLVHGSIGFCLFFLLYFLAVGFLSGYLVTRIWLPYVMLMSSLAMDSAIEAAVGIARQQGARAALRMFGLSDASEPPKPGGTAGGTPGAVSKSVVGAPSAAPSAAALGDDPNKGKFDGKAEVNGLKLSAQVTKMDDIDEDYFRVSLKVTTDGSRKLDQPVTFHLHPTFNPPEVKVSPVNGQAVLDRAAWGAFTVGVTVDGEETKLELDLAELPNVPDLFKSR